MSLHNSLTLVQLKSQRQNFRCNGRIFLKSLKWHVLSSNKFELKRGSWNIQTFQKCINNSTKRWQNLTNYFTTENNFSLYLYLYNYSIYIWTTRQIYVPSFNKIYICQQNLCYKSTRTWCRMLYHNRKKQVHEAN